MGARTGDGRFELVTALQGTPERGRFIARGPDPSIAHLVAVSGPLAMQYEDAEGRLALRGVGGVAPLDHVGPLEPDAHPLGLVACVERLPRGLASHNWAAAGPLPFATVVSLGAQLAAIVARARATGHTLWTIRPEVVYVTGSVGSAFVTGIAPRCEQFWSLEAPRDGGRFPVFADVFTAPERIHGEIAAAGDAFAVAATVAYWATGHPPFVGEALDEQTEASRAGHRRPWTADWRLAAIIGPALDPSPGNRPTIEDLAVLLANVR